MKLPLANGVTLGVLDFEGDRDFYRRLGWPLAFDSGSYAVFELRGALLALSSVDELGSAPLLGSSPAHLLREAGGG